MNKNFLSIRTWVLTHKLWIWGEGVLIALFFGIAVGILWESFLGVGADIP